MSQYKTQDIRWIALGGGNEEREYTLTRSPRQTLAITIEPTGQLAVRAPQELSVERVDAVLRKRREWIRRRTREVALLPPPRSQHEWVSGETHRYLGRQYRLRVQRDHEAHVGLQGAFFLVTLPAPHDRHWVRDLMQGWLREHAREIFTRRLEALVRSATRLRLAEPPPLMVRALRTKWGSCSPAGHILMNVDAVRLPLCCVDYVLLHELCHLREPNHAPRFWRLLDACMPDWERWRQRLAHAEI